ncbi:MAG TPA: hypothetical protein VG796_14675 [Verrucomicrobiales bacterium]|jgi:hypothetical protein|nr:hypothetical protein [Verrucomicrobiales bacterium]
MNYHLKRTADDWKLLKEGVAKPIGSFGNELMAESAAIEYVKAHGGTLKIHGDEAFRLVLRLPASTPSIQSFPAVAIDTEVLPILA